MANGVKTGGRQKGTPNKMTAQLREMILNALDASGGEAYLQSVAASHPPAFLALLGKVLPMQVENAEDDEGNPKGFHVIQRTVVDPAK